MTDEEKWQEAVATLLQQLICEVSELNGSQFPPDAVISALMPIMGTAVEESPSGH